MKKVGFTLVEVLISSSIIGIVLIASISIMSFITSTLYNGQTERKNQLSLTDNIYYLTREVQSAESIKISADCKVLKIKQLGNSDFNIEYKITNGSPTGTFSFKSKKMFDVDYDKSSFIISNGKVKIILAIYKNNLDFNAKPHLVEFEAMPRSEGVFITYE